MVGPLIAPYAMYSVPGQKKLREVVVTREIVEAKDKSITLIEKAG